MQFNNQLIDLPNLYQVIERYPLTIGFDSPVVDAIVLMNQGRSSSPELVNFSTSLASDKSHQQVTSYVLVVEKTQLLGIFTLRDVLRLAALGMDLTRVTIAEVMTKKLITLKQSEFIDISTALLLLKQHQIHHLPIVDDEEKLIGIVTQSSLLEELNLVKIVGIAKATQQYLEKSIDGFSENDQQIDSVVNQTHLFLQQWVEEQVVQEVKINAQLQQSLEELQIVEEEMREYNQQLVTAREIAELERRRYQDLFEVTPYGYVVTDKFGKIEQVNHAASLLLSVEQNYLIDKPIEIFFSTQSERHEIISQLKNLQAIQEWEIGIKPRQGKPFFANVRIIPMYDYQGEWSGWCWFLCDISKRKKAEEALQRSSEQLEHKVAERTAELVIINQALQEEIIERQQIEAALRESEAKFRQFADNIQAVVWITSSDCTDNIYVNPAYEKIWGRSRASIISNPQSWFEAVHPEDRDRVMMEMQCQINSDAASLEYRIVRPDQSIRWLWARRFLIKNEQGQMQYFGGISEDITERKQAEEALRKSEEIFRQFGENIQSQIIWIKSYSSGETVYVNPAYEKIWGRSCQSLRENPQSWMESIHSEDRDRILTQTWHNLQNGEPSYLEYRIVHPNGSIRWIWARCFPIKNEQGQIQYFGGVAEDITDRKQTEAAQRKTEERLNLALDAANMGIWDWEIQTNKTLWSANMGLMYGLPKNTLCPSPEDFLNLIYPEDRDYFHEAVENAIEQRVEFAAEHRVIWNDGSIHWLSAKGKVYYDENDQPARMIGTTRDISAQKQAEQKIYEQAALLNIATDAIFVRDFQTEILFWNQGAERIYGWQTHEALGKNLKDIFNSTTSSQQEIVALQKVVKFGTWQGELYKKTKFGQDIIVESRWTLMFDSEQQPKSILIVDTDITQKKELEEQFYRTQRLESIGTLAGGIAHDINNILTPILASAQLLKGRFANNEERHPQLLTIIENNARRGAGLVKQVLSFARGLKGERAIVQVKHLITDIIQIGKQTFPKSIEFAAKISEDLWAVFGDSTQLHQVLMNLVVNARDAMPEGGNLLIIAENLFIDETYTRMHFESKVGHYIVITVTDTGMGMTPEVLDRIFEPFFTTKEVGTGTGLGLSTVRGIIKSHDGFVRVYSQVGKGSTFKIFLPSVEVSQIATVENLEMISGQGELILIVDDEQQILDVATIILEKYNYQTITAKNGIEAVALYAQHKKQIKAVLMDMMMPGMDGINAIRTLQKINPQVQVVACSGLNTIEILPESANTQVQAVLLKPYTANELLRNINQTVRNS